MRHALIVSLVLAGCAAAKQDVKAAEQAFVDCAKVDVTQAVTSGGPALIGKVTAVLSGASENWSADLDGLKATATSDAVNCATKAAVAVVLAQAAQGVEMPLLVQRGNKYISAVKFK